MTGLFPKWLGNEAVIEIVGVVDDMLPDSLEARPQPQIFVAQGPATMTGNATFVVKTEGEALFAMSRLKEIVQQQEPAATLNRTDPLAAKISASVADRRFATSVLVAFAALALALATTGLYGVVSYNVAQRRREIGVRAALGATRTDLMRMVLRDGLVPAGAGIALGLFVSLFAARALTSMLFGVAPLDRVAFTASALLLLVVAARRAWSPPGAPPLSIQRWRFALSERWGRRVTPRRVTPGAAPEPSPEPRHLILLSLDAILLYA